MRAGFRLSAAYAIPITSREYATIREVRKNRFDEKREYQCLSIWDWAMPDAAIPPNQPHAVPMQSHHHFAQPNVHTAGSWPHYKHLLSTWLTKGYRHFNTLSRRILDAPPHILGLVSYFSILSAPLHKVVA